MDNDEVLLIFKQAFIETNLEIFNQDELDRRDVLKTNPSRSSSSSR